MNSFHRIWGDVISFDHMNSNIWWHLPIPKRHPLLNNSKWNKSPCWSCLILTKLEAYGAMFVYKYWRHIRILFLCDVNVYKYSFDPYWRHLTKENISSYCLLSKNMFIPKIATDQVWLSVFMILLYRMSFLCPKYSDCLLKVKKLYVGSGWIRGPKHSAMDSMKAG